MGTRIEVVETWKKKLLTVVCTLCPSNFNVQKGGFKYIRHHKSTHVHQKNPSADEQVLLFYLLSVSQTTKWLMQKLGGQTSFVKTICQLNLVTVSPNLTSRCSPDSEIAKKFYCLRTKPSQIIVHALGKLLLWLEFLFPTVETNLYKVIQLRRKASGGNLKTASHGKIVSVCPLMVPKSWWANLILYFRFLHCACHVAHLAASHTCGELPDVCEQLTKDVYVNFKTSDKREDYLSRIQDLIDIENHSILWPFFIRGGWSFCSMYNGF
ncbi:hypothetical protein PR048_017747 [Dryococelus australis]|uniref:Uncharacterized protein n=1 Tax=Dryococelus australis TaxID=614101 RepID=A0ABQ9HAN6_9NEOP|nr:hypothetical protein PR048_017747 [Dryococelus australis]